MRALAQALGVRGADVALDPASKNRRKRVAIDGDGALLSARLLGLAAEQSAK